MNIRPNRITPMTLDVPSLRSDTPGVANALHFNNAGASSSSTSGRSSVRAQRDARYKIAENSGRGDPGSQTIGNPRNSGNGLKGSTWAAG